MQCGFAKHSLVSVVRHIGSWTPQEANTRSNVSNTDSHWGHKYFSDFSFSFYIDWANHVRWLLWENVEHSNCYCWLRKGYQLLDVLIWFFLCIIKMQILPFSYFMLWAMLFAVKLYYSLHSFCIFLNMFSVVCLHFHTLTLCFVLVFLLLCVFAQ